MAEPAGIDAARLKQLLRRLIDSYSPTGKEEALVDSLYGHLRRQGLLVRRQPVEDRRHNLLLEPAGIEPGLLLVGHLDTVPAYDLDQVEFEERDGRVFGLGAADMKGGCAALLEAYRIAWLARGGRLPAALALVVGEEEAGDGAEALLTELAPPWALIAEPTGLAVCPGSYGYLELQLAAAGRRVHASLADAQPSAVGAVLQAAGRLVEGLAAERPELVVNVRDLFSSPAGFAVAERCEAWFDVHAPPEVSLEELVADIEARVQRAAPQEGLAAEVRFTTVDPGFSLPERGPLLESLRAIYARRRRPWTPAAFRSHSDAGALWRSGVRPVILGPGQLEQAHAPDESVDFAQVREAAEIYLELLLGLGDGE